MKIQVEVNEGRRDIELDGHESATEIIRDRLGLTGTKLVCAGGVCGACTIQVDGEPVASCLLPATSMDRTAVTTVEGIAGPDGLHPVQRAFVAHDGLQCGYCTPGFVVDAVAFHDRWRAEHGTTEPDRHTIADALAGHLCRCGAYGGIFRAVAAACRGEHDDPDAPVTTHRLEGPAKVTGRAVYTTDVAPPGMLHAVIRRSTTAAAEVRSIDLAAAPHVVDLVPDDRRIRYAGQPILAVAAETSDAARRLADAVDVRLEEVPFVLDPAEAIADGAPLVHDDRSARKAAPNAAEGPIAPARWDGNVRKTNRFSWRGRTARRRIEAARSAASPSLAELTVRTVPQLHTSFEPHACVADWSDPELLRVWVSTQAVDHLAHQIADRFDLDHDRVEVIAEHVGGGFGSKLGLTVEVIAAVELSRRARRPVRLVLDRTDELTATGNRPGMAAEVSVLASDDGSKLRALDLDVENHAGTAINNVVGLLGTLMYGRGPRASRDVDVVTNAPPGTPFRGPGGPLYCLALEQGVDQVAHQLGLDPIAVRRRWDGNPKRQALYEWAAALAVWRDRPAAGSQRGRYRRGVGVAAANWVYFVDPGTEVTVGVEDGRLTVETATQDMGTGSRSVLAKAVADVFDVAPGDVTVRLGRSTGTTPHGPTSGGSRTTASIWSTATEAAGELRAELGSTPLAEASGRSATAKRGGDRGLRPLPITIADVQFGRGFSAALHVSEVEVDTLTGTVRVLTVHGGIATGVIHAPVLARSQCEGSIIQGIGLALYEQQLLDPHTGLTLTSNLEDYRIPQLGDTPEMTIHFHEAGWDRVPGGGVGLGEVATISPAASVANAVFNATGWRPDELPIRPDRVVEALR